MRLCRVVNRSDGQRVRPRAPPHEALESPKVHACARGDTRARYAVYSEFRFSGSGHNTPVFRCLMCARPIHCFTGTEPLRPRLGRAARAVGSLAFAGRVGDPLLSPTLAGGEHDLGCQKPATARK